ncbi:MAG TPA: hypothetical protein VGE11_02410 [Pseudonocardia sp.]
MSHAGLVALLGLAEQTRLPEILTEKVSITTSQAKSGAANPAPKLLPATRRASPTRADQERYEVAV